MKDKVRSGLLRRWGTGVAVCAVVAFGTLAATAAPASATTASVCNVTQGASGGEYTLVVATTGAKSVMIFPINGSGGRAELISCDTAPDGYHSTAVVEALEGDVWTQWPQLGAKVDCTAGNGKYNDDFYNLSTSTLTYRIEAAAFNGNTLEHGPAFSSDYVH